MPLYDPNDALSREAPLLLRIADIIAKTRGAQRLTETDNETAARKQIVIVGGPDLQPWGKTYKRNQLENEHCIIFVDPDEDESHACPQPDKAPKADCPDEIFGVRVHIRRQVREHELANIDARSDVYLFFVDCQSSIERDLHGVAENQGATQIRRIERDGRPEWSTVVSENTEGPSLEGSFIVVLGDEFTG